MVLCLPVLLLFCLCRHGLTDETTPAPVSSSPQTDKEGEVCGDVFGLEAQRAVGGAITKLGLQLLEELRPGPEQPNVILSPLSVSLALAQLALGARNETEQQILKALYADSLPCYHKTLSGLQQHLTAKPIQVASRLYLRPGFEVNRDFVQESLHLYKSEPAQLTGVEEVNQWVEEATKGHMTNFLSSIPPSVVLMLINAIHFKGEWQSRFDQRFTAKDLFYIDSDTSVEVDMMLSPKFPLSMFVDGELGFQVARFPFQGNTSFLVVMPMPLRGNVSTVVAKLNISDLYKRLPSETTNMRVKLPKFKLEYKQELQEALTSMGLGSLFSGPDLSGITKGPLLVSSVQHAASIELSEEGAEASAATSIQVMRSVPIFAVNMPFVFALVDDASFTPLFLGVVTNPNSGASDEPQNDSPPSNEMHSDRLHGDDPHSGSPRCNNLQRDTSGMGEESQQSSNQVEKNHTEQ